MYKLIVWDKSLAAAGHVGSIAEVEVPIELAQQFFRLDSIAFPLLSSLSFDDYDLFSGDELSALAAEMRKVQQNLSVFARDIESIIGVVGEAQSQGRAVLFDPFQ
jgi:hypothetical protein